MPQQRYRFVSDYASGFGRYTTGQVIEVEPDVAEWINRDIPGSLEAVSEVNPAKMSREELNAYAAGKGVADPESLGSKDEVIAAIDGATGEGPKTEEEQLAEANITPIEPLQEPNVAPTDTDTDEFGRAVTTPRRTRRVGAPPVIRSE
jgi:hypothetical protein